VDSVIVLEAADERRDAIAVEKHVFPLNRDPHRGAMLFAPLPIRALDKPHSSRHPDSVAPTRR
jgi:hypothetical protein